MSNTAPDGNQAAFIGDTGSMSTTIDFTQTGTFAIQLYGANKHLYENAIRLYLGSQEITPDYQNDPNYANPFDYALGPRPVHVRRQRYRITTR